MVVISICQVQRLRAIGLKMALLKRPIASLIGGSNSDYASAWAGILGGSGVLPMEIEIPTS